MSQYQNFGSFIADNKELLKEYIDTRIEIIRLRGVKTLSQALGVFLTAILVAFFLMLVLLLLIVGLALFLSEKLHSHLAGFGIAAGIVLFIMMVTVIAGRRMIRNMLTRQFLKATEGAEEEDEVNI